MPLSPAVEREHLHTRAYDFRGYSRADGLWDIEGRMTDVKTYGFDNEHRGHIAAHEPLHDMSIRLTIDETFTIRDIEAVTDAGPYAICPVITPNFRKVVGLRLGLGWRRRIRERLGGVEGCTHLVEMLAAMATVAFQTLYPTLAKKGRTQTSGGKSPLIDSCHAYASDGEIVKKTWPDHYTGT